MRDERKFTALTAKRLSEHLEHFEHFVHLQKLGTQTWSLHSELTTHGTYKECINLSDHPETELATQLPLGCTTRPERTNTGPTPVGMMLGKGETREERRERREQPEHLQQHSQIALNSTRSTQDHLGPHSAHRALRSKKTSQEYKKICAPKAQTTKLF